MPRTNRPLADLLGTDETPPKRERGRPPQAHRQAKVEADTELVRLKIAKMRGELIPAADVEAQWAEIITDARQRLLALPSRLGSRLGLSREQVAEADAEIRGVLTALSASGGVSDDPGH